MNIVVKDKPVVSVNDSMICNGNSALLTATPVVAGGNYKWSTGETTQFISVSPTSTTQYYVIYTGVPDLCPSDTVFSTVTVNPKSKSIFTAVSPVCNGSLMSALPLISNNGIHGAWSPALNNLATTTYTFTPSTTECASDTTMTIVVNSKPTIALGNSIMPSTCNGKDGSIEITGLQLNTSYTVDYKKNNIDTSYSSVSDGNGKILISGLSAGSYKNINVILSGCTSNSLLGPIVLTDPTVPNANASGTTAICEGQTLSLSSNNPGLGASYAWSGPNGYTSISQNPTVSLSAQVNMSGTYAVKQTYKGCVGAISTVDIVVTPSPSAGIITGINPICIGITTTYSSSVNGGTWSSTNPAVASVDAATGLVTTAISGNADITYTVVGTGGCSDVSATKSIIVKDNYTISLSSVLESDTQTVCLNTAIDPIEYTITDAIGVTTQNLPNGINASVVGSKVTISGTPSTKGTFNYVIKATGGCGTDSVIGQIIVGDMLVPSVSISSSDVDNIICLGTGVTFTAHPTNGGTTPTYQWKLNGVDVFGENSNIYTKSTLVNNDQVSVVMTSNSACAFPLTAISNVITTTIGNNVSPSFNAKASICEDEIYSLPTTSIEGSLGTWSPSMNLKATTTYTFTPDVAGCYTTTTYTLIVNPLPVLTTTVSSADVCNNTATNIKLSSTTLGTTFTWTTTQSPSVTGASNGSGSTIAQVLKLTGNVQGTADYTITPKAGTCVGLPKTVNLIVKPSVVPSVLARVDTLIDDTITICPDYSLTFNALPTNGGTNPIYQWKINNVNKPGTSKFT